MQKIEIETTFKPPFQCKGFSWKRFLNSLRANYYANLGRLHVKVNEVNVLTEHANCHKKKAWRKIIACILLASNHIGINDHSYIFQRAQIALALWLIYSCLVIDSLTSVYTTPETVLGTVLKWSRNGSMSMWTAKVFLEPFQFRTVSALGVSDRLWAWIRSWITTFFFVWLEPFQWTVSSIVNLQRKDLIGEMSRKWLFHDRCQSAMFAACV